MDYKKENQKLKMQIAKQKEEIELQVKIITKLQNRYSALQDKWNAKLMMEMYAEIEREEWHN